MKKVMIYFLISSIIPGKHMSQTTIKSAEENRSAIALLDSFANAFNAHDADKIISYMTEDCIFEASAGPDANGEKFVGKQAVKKAFEDIFKSYPDAKWSIHTILSPVTGPYLSGYSQEQNQMAAR
jgi:hypothetical protein